MSNGGGSTRRRAGGRAGRSRGTAEGGTPKTFLMRRRPGEFATAGMLADGGACDHDAVGLYAGAMDLALRVQKTLTQYPLRRLGRAEDIV